MLKIDLAKGANSLKQAIEILNTEPGSMQIIPLYGTGKE